MKKKKERKKNLFAKNNNNIKQENKETILKLARIAGCQKAKSHLCWLPANIVNTITLI